MTIGKINPKVESVFSRARSPVQDFRFSPATVTNRWQAPASTPIFDDMEHNYEDGKEELAGGEDEGVKNGGRREIEDLEREILNLRCQMARDSLEQTRTGSNYLPGDETELRESAGDFHYFQPSPQDVSEVVPDRFHPGRESSSVLRNITVRESKRSKSRTLDQEYQRRVSFIAAGPRASLRSGGSVTPGSSPNSPVLQNEFGTYGVRYPDGPRYSPMPEQLLGGLSFTPPSSGGPRGNGSSVRNQLPDHGHRGFAITLAHEGHLMQHIVTAGMAVETLIADAAGEYGLIDRDTVLFLFGVNPRRLVRGKVLSDSPVVGPGDTVLVMVIAGEFPRATPSMGGRVGSSFQHEQTHVMAFPNSGGGSKLLGNFKLPKFDGTARHWKNWDKSLVRFLSIHQLDQVLAETFLDSLPLSPQDFAANKLRS